MTEDLYEKLTNELGTSLAAMYQAKSEMERLEAENARLRKALEKYADSKTHSMDPSGFVWSGDYFDYDTARAALEGKE